MRTVLQRVSQAQVKVDHRVTGQIKNGWLVLFGVGQGDTAADLDYIVDRIVKLRAFADETGKMNLSLDQVGGSILLVSQFTLYGDCSSRRPGFAQAAAPELAKELYELAIAKFRDISVRVETGMFAADMQVSLTNDGPVTFWLDSRFK